MGQRQSVVEVHHSLAVVEEDIVVAVEEHKHCIAVVRLVVDRSGRPHQPSRDLLENTMRRCMLILDDCLQENYILKLQALADLNTCFLDADRFEVGLRDTDWEAGSVFVPEELAD